MRHAYRAWAAGLLVAAMLSLSGCSGNDGGGDPKPSASASTVRPVLTPRAALDSYKAAIASGCTDAAECQDLMTRKPAAAAVVRNAMAAKDAALYAVPISYVDLAERQADHVGQDNLGSKGNSLAVSLPLQRMVAWFREHPEA